MNEWSLKIHELNRAGMTYQAIADSLGCAPSTIGDLATGRSKEPKVKVALGLLKLHKAKQKAIKAAQVAA